MRFVFNFRSQHATLSAKHFQQTGKQSLYIWDKETVKNWVEETVENPDWVEPGYKGRMLYHRTYRLVVGYQKSKPLRTVRVVVAQDGTVITHHPVE